MSLHVALVTKRYPQAVGGDATAVAALESCLRATGDRVTIITSRSSGISRRPQVHRVGIPRSDAALDRPGPVRALSCLWAVLWGLWFLTRHRPDVVHAHAPELGAALALPARVLGIPRLLTLHGTTIGQPAFGLKSRLERLLVRLGGYDRLFTVDPRSLPALHGLARTPAVFVPNGVRTDDCPAWQGPREDAPILFVGRLEAVKGVDVLLTAVAKARAGGCPATLDIVGSGRLEPDLRRLATSLSLEDRVSFRGACSHAEVLERMTGAAALVLPSNYEGFPLVLLEAWAVGVPVIVTAVGAAPQVCTDGRDALLVEPDDPDALAGAVTRLLADPLLARRLGSTGRRTVERYSQTQLAEQVREHYGELVSRRAPHGPPRHRRDVGRLRSTIGGGGRTAAAAGGGGVGPLRGRGWIAGCLLCLVAAVVPLAYLTSHQPAVGAGRSAALYFPAPSHIDSWTGRRSVSFAFVVRNLSGERRAVRFAVAVTPQGRTARPQGSRVVVLGPGQQRLFRRTVPAPPRRRFEVTVTVPGTTNGIHFWARAPSA